MLRKLEHNMEQGETIEFDFCPKHCAMPIAIVGRISVTIYILILIGINLFIRNYQIHVAICTGSGQR